MGIPGILKEIGKGERIALSKLAVEHLERTQRPLRIAVDAAIWNFQTQSGQGGKNPALRTLYYKLLKLLALPIHPVFVYDGKNKPLVKRGRTVTRWGSCIANETSKKLIHAFSFPCHTAPGEAEAECALLQRKGVVDMVMSQDGDAIMFGSAVTLRDWSKEGTRGNKTPTHVSLLDLHRIKERTGLDPDGMVLVALLSGGDYDQNGVAGFGPALACEVARAGFGADLLDILRKDDAQALREWRERLQFELETNESGYFKTKHKSLKVPDNFPDRTLLGYYINPAVSAEHDLGKLEETLAVTWNSEIDIPALRHYVGETFDWLYKPGAWKFVRGMAPALLANKLRRGLAQQFIGSIDQITERRQHFVNDGIPELRVAATPAKVVGLDLDAEEDSPEYLAGLAEEQDDGDVKDGSEAAGAQTDADDDMSSSQCPTKRRKSPTWNPYLSEKVWIAQTIVQLGVPELVEEWQQAQRDMLADPVKFATRKCRTAKTLLKGKAALGTNAGAMQQYLINSKPKNSSFVLQDDVSQLRQPLQQRENLNRPPNPKMPTKYDGKTAKQPSPPNLAHFLKASKLLARYEGNENSDSIQTATDIFKYSDDPAGASTENFIYLSSSPVVEVRHEDLPRSQPLTPREIDKTLDGGAVHSELIELSASVTRRKRKANRPQATEQPVEQTIVSEQQPVTIESFFRPIRRNLKQNSSTAASRDNSKGIELPSDLSTGLKVDFASKGSYVIPRESLPGTFKEIDFEEDIMPGRPRRGLRVSYVDLTGE